MTVQEAVITVEGQEWHRVKPVDHISSGERRRTRPFTFTRTYVSDVPETSFEVPTGAEYRMVDDGMLWYQYRDRPEVLVTQNGPYAKPDNQKESAEKQAYFVMSIMDEYGLVSGWKRK